MSKRLAITVGAAILAGMSWVHGLPAGSAEAALIAAEQAPPAAQAQPRTPDMKTMHDQMMAEQKAAGARLDQLVADMNLATGDAKVAAVAQVVSELVRQQKAMHAHMGMMCEQMGHGMGHHTPGRK